MTSYTLLILALAVLAPLPWIGIYHLDRRCAGGRESRGRGSLHGSLSSADRRARRERQIKQLLRWASSGLGGPT